MKKMVLLSAMTLAVLCGCDDSSSSVSPDNSGSAGNPSYDNVVKNFDDLQVCSEKREGQEIFVSDESEIYKCVDGSWTVKETSPDKPSKDDPAKGSKDEKSSSSFAKSSSSVKSSSSIESSSSVHSSSSVVGDGYKEYKYVSPYTTEAVGTHPAYKTTILQWRDDIEGRVQTGSEEESAGYWYAFSDNNSLDKGNSKVLFPSDVEANEWGNFFGPLAETYGSIKAKADIGDAYEKPYAGVGFDLYSEHREGVDISELKGLCLAYSSTEDFVVELVSENEKTVTGYNNYKAVISQKSGLTTVDIPWSKFVQESDLGVVVNLEEALKSISSIRIKFTSSAEFTIFGIGEYGAYSPCWRVAPA